MATTNLVLKICIGAWGNARALRDGTVKIPGVDLEFVEIDPVHTAFKRMIERLEFDVSEMAMTTYMVARSFDKPLTALPLVLFRKFHHGTILYNVSPGVREPKDLEGKKVGFRAYAQTGPTWSRGILHHEYGVDLSKVTWVTYEGSHVAELQDPENVVRAPQGKKMVDMLLDGEIDAAIGADVSDFERVKPLISDAPAVEAEWYRRTGIYPMNHIVVIKSELAARHPWLQAELFNAFKKAKEIYLDRLYREGPSFPEDKLTLELRETVDGDPLPFGVRANRKAVEALSQYALEHGILPRPYSVEEFFGPGVADLE
jgi:4,5-dihydroxyphthalate decarboxylase